MRIIFPPLAPSHRLKFLLAPLLRLGKPIHSLLQNTSHVIRVCHVVTDGGTADLVKDTVWPLRRLHPALDLTCLGRDVHHSLHESPPKTVLVVLGSNDVVDNLGRDNVVDVELTAAAASEVDLGNDHIEVFQKLLNVYRPRAINIDIVENPIAVEHKGPQRRHPQKSLELLAAQRAARVRVQLLKHGLQLLLYLFRTARLCATLGQKLGQKGFFLWWRPWL
mmetsp:Transcript_43477/g.84945  ORF Transcript_43477/g.84945 Transcript_43477/m.84945 type:complete len:221 (+) Transcript_43477:1038-1700(+)